ncbi:IS110 family transposase [Anaerosporobacter sp.]|uniref:IS110 family transposase n=1 Tax=Anaerosporobacter sp. TaxID=1872529 RepID=UPI003FA41B92
MSAYRAQDKSREFATTTAEIRKIVTWLKSNGCQMVAMESTASYRKPLYNIFEQEALPTMVCNAYYIKNVPVNNTDFTLNDVKACMHHSLKSSPEELYAAIDGYITPTQREFFAHYCHLIYFHINSLFYLRHYPLY